MIYRESHETESTDDTQLTMMLTTYTYQSIITNTDLKPLPLLRTYNQRANIENRIDELKDGYAVKQNSLHDFMKNLLFCWIKVISCNLMVWFKQALLPKDLQKCEVKTIRRVILKIPGNVVGSGRYQHICLAPCAVLEEIITVMQLRMGEFAKEKIPILHHVA